MPTVSRWFIKSGMLYLLLALAGGVPLAGARQLGLRPEVAVLWPTWVHALVVGWLTQLIFGVGFWMFPRYSAQQPRGRELLAWATFLLLNLGLGLRMFVEPWTTFGGPGGGWLMLSGLLQFGAAVGFAVNTWPRVRQR